MTEVPLQGREQPPEIDPRDGLCILRDAGSRPRVLGFLTLRTVNSGGLYEALGDTELADYVRKHTAGRVQLLTGLYTARGSSGSYDVGQLLMTEALSRSLGEDCSYAVWHATASEETLDLLERQGFVPAELPSAKPLLLVDMRSPSVLLQNIPTTLKEPFSSDRTGAGGGPRRPLPDAAGSHRPVSRFSDPVPERGGHLPPSGAEDRGPERRPGGAHQCPGYWVPRCAYPSARSCGAMPSPTPSPRPSTPTRSLPGTCTSFDIENFPGYAPLESQIRTIHSFRRPVILVDDLLHSGNRIRALDPLFRQEGVVIDRVLVGLLSGRGRDLMAAKGRSVDSVYFIPNMRSWFVESTMYPFIGGDTVGHEEPSVPGLTPAVNLILPYAFPRFYRECGREAVFRFSCACLENARDILLALETTFRERYARNLTLSRLSEAVILPLSPDKGSCMHYDPSLPASVFLQNDLEMLLRMRNVLQS